MGKKGGGAKQEITRYYMSLHLGVCAGADAITAIYAKEKLLWSGEVTSQSAFIADNGQLFGGRLKEGGVEAVVYWLPGASTQVLPDLLAQKLGRANGADCPGFRGLASAFFVGPVGTPFASASNWAETTETRRGAYWSANNPYLPGVWITVRRAPVGLDPDYAMVPRPGTGDVTLVLPRHSAGWKYLTEPYDTVGSDYSAPGFDDSAWATGTAPFYKGTPHPYSEINNWGYGTGTNIVTRQDVWMRRTLAVPTGTLLSVASAHDNEIQLWVDGVEVPMVPVGAWTSVGSFTSPTSPVVIAVRIDETTTEIPGNYTFGDIEITSTNNAADANPAHIIYECLTNTDWGMGSPATAIDTQSFEDAGVTLYAEGFGLSMIWTRQAAIQDFVQEVLDHIRGVVFVDPATGLLTLKLIRGDYDENDLPELNPDNAELGNFSRKLWGEIINEVIVSWTNPENEQEETVTMQDLASIATQGTIISDKRNYYGVRYADLATQLAIRDLRSDGQPLAACEAEVDRTLWDIRPASVVTVTWPEHGLAGVVMRVTSVDYGRPGDPTIKLSLIEDVFGLDAGDYVAPPSSDWVDPSEAPAALTEEKIFTLPLFFALNSPAAEFVTDPAYPEVVAGILGSTTQSDAYGFDLWDEVTLSNGSLEWQELTSLNIIGHAELAGALGAESSSTGVTFANVIGDTSPTVAGFVIIGDGDEDEVEIAQFDATGATYDLRRGLLDTVPRAWPAGTPLWFLDEETMYEDPTVRSAGETVDYKLLTSTSQGTLALADAALVSYELTDRPWLPNRPANVAVDGVLFNTAATPVDMTDRTDPWVTISWANRNRLTEDSQVLGWTDATVTPETGQTTRIEVYAENGTTLLATHDSLSGTSFNVPDASFGTEMIVLIKAWGKRTDGDGTFVSLQAHGIWVQVGAPDRITEDGDRRITEDGDVRTLEG